MHSKLLYRIGILQERMGFTSTAIGTQRRAIRSCPGLAAPRAVKLMLASDDLDGAREVAELWRSLEPESIAANERLGFILERSKKYEEAAEAYSKALTCSEANRGRLLYRRGCAFMGAGNLASAKTDFWTACADPEYLGKATERIMGILRETNAGPAERRKCLEAGIPAHPIDEDWLRSLADIYVGSGIWSKAIGLYEQLVSIGKAGKFTFYQLGICYLQEGDRENADRFFSRALAKLPKSEQRFGLGAIHQDRGQWTLAASEYESADVVVALEGERYYRLGICRENLFEFVLAVKAYKTALFIEPDRKVTAFRLAVSLERSGRTKAAAYWYLKCTSIAKLSGQHPAFHAARVLAASDTGEALKMFAELDEGRAWRPYFVEANVDSGRDDNLNHVSDLRSHALRRTRRGQMCSRLRVAELIEAGKFDCAIAEARILVQSTNQIVPQDYWILGELLRRQGEMRESLRAFCMMYRCAAPVVPAADKRVSAWQAKTEQYVIDREAFVLDDNLILYEVGHGSSISCNPAAIFRALQQLPEGRACIHVWAVDDESRIPDWLDQYSNAVCVKRESEKYFRILATARYLLNNTSFGSYFIRREGQVYMNTWHGTPLKSLGAAVKDEFLEYGNISRNLLQCTHLAVGNQWTAEVLLKEHQVNQIFTGQVVVEGTARIDELVNSIHGADRDLSLGVRCKKKILYAPTWRGTLGSDGEIDFDLEQEVRNLRALESLGYDVSYSAHRFVKDLAIGSALERYMIPTSVDLYEVLAQTDILITDYSSVYFDFLVTDRPIIFFVPDWEEYVSARGVYDLPMPGYFCRSIQDIVTALKEIDSGMDRYSTERSAARPTFCPLEDGSSAERLARILLGAGGLTNDVEADVRTPATVFRHSFIANGIATAFRVLTSEFVSEAVGGPAVVVVDRASVASSADRRANVVKLNPEVSILPRVGTTMLTREERYINQAEDRNEKWLTQVHRETLEAAYSREWNRCLGSTRVASAVEYDGYSRFWARFVLGAGHGATHSIFLHNNMALEQREKHPDLNAVFDLYGSFDYVVSVSESVFEANFRALGPSIEDSTSGHTKWTWANNPVDTIQIVERAGEQLTPEVSEALSSISEDYLVAVGRLSAEKGYERLLNTYATVSKKESLLPLVIVGEGPDRGKLIALRDELGLNKAVCFLGQVENPYPVIARSKGLGLFSLWEGQGLVLIEAMVLGVPVAATDIPGPHSVLENTSGLLVENTDGGVAAGLVALTNGEILSANVDWHAYNESSLLRVLPALE